MRLSLLFLIALSACVADSTSVEQGLCTVDDTDCGNGGGGGPPAGLPQTTTAYATTVASQYGTPGRTERQCTNIACTVEIDIPCFVRVIAVCSDDGQGVSCVSQVYYQSC